MVESEKASVRNDSLADIIKGTLTPIGPDASNGLYIFSIVGKSSKGQDPKFKVLNIFAIKLGQSNKFTNIMHDLWLWPSLKQVML
jgi:hypothetical protein